MTTKVVIACPDNSVHNALVYVETKDGGEWSRAAPPLVIEPRGQAAPIYLTTGQRVVVEEEDRARAETKPVEPPVAAPKS